MSTPRHAKVPVLLAGAAFLWSAWAASPLRFALMTLRPAPPAKPGVMRTQQEKIDSVSRLGDALRNPKAISNRDVGQARSVWGDEAVRLLSLIR